MYVVHELLEYSRKGMVLSVAPSAVQKVAALVAGMAVESGDSNISL